MPSHSKQNSCRNKKKCVKKMFQYSEEALRAALYEIRENKMAVRLASRTYGVPRTTIQDRLLGKIPDKQGKTGPEPRLTVDGEKKVADWVMKLAKCGFPIKKVDLIETVEKIVKDSGKKNIFKNGRPGQRWYQNFLKRHPMISLREAESINKARAIVTEESIRLWFFNLEKYLRDNNLYHILKDPDRIFNGDESGFSLCPKTGKILAAKGWKNLYQIKKGNEKENITVYISFTASGKVCPPLVVFPYIRPPRTVVENIPKNWVLGKSDTGWMKGDVFYEYIVNDFNEWVSENNIERPILLFIDGHKSHMTMALSEACEQNKIILYALPPNTTHILQPADVSVFRPLKQEWKNTIRKWQTLPENINSSVTKTNFCKVFEMTLRETNMENHIKNGFRKCGLFPLNPNNVDFSKCVKNLLESHNPNSTPQEEKITSEECRIAEKIINKIKNILSSYAINTEVILKEIRFLEESEVHGSNSNVNTANRQDQIQYETADETKSKTENEAKLISASDPKSTQESITEHLEGNDVEVGSIVNLEDVEIMPINNEPIITDNELFVVMSTDISSETINVNTEKMEHRKIIKKTITKEDLQMKIRDIAMDTNENLQEVSREITINSKVNLQESREMVDITTKENLQKEFREITSIDGNDNIQEESRESMMDISNKENLQQEPREIIMDITNNNESKPKQTNFTALETGKESQMLLTGSDDGKLDPNKENNKCVEALDKETTQVQFGKFSFNGSDAFDKHLTYPDPIKKIKSTNEILPSAISSDAWRKYYQEKDSAKKQKTDEVKKRKEERLLSKQKRLKQKKTTTRSKKLKTVTPLQQEQVSNFTDKAKAHCASCMEILESDTEDDDEKNIGCDYCPRWYHMRCTEFIGLPYHETAEKEYRCDYCT